MTRVSHNPDRPTYPEYEKRHGEDPARFLYSDIDDLSPRINAIETVELVRAWLDVETDKDQPDTGIIGALNERQQELQDAEATEETAHVGAEAST